MIVCDYHKDRDLSMNDTNTLLPYFRLRFNIDHPSYEESYALGYASCMNNEGEHTNPFLQDSQAAQHWSEGWWDALEGAAPLFTLEQDVKETSEAGGRHIAAANDNEYQQKHSIMSFLIEITGAIAASAILGYQLFELIV